VIDRSSFQSSTIRRGRLPSWSSRRIRPASSASRSARITVAVEQPATLAIRSSLGQHTTARPQACEARAPTTSFVRGFRSRRAKIARGIEGSGRFPLTASTEGVQSTCPIGIGLPGWRLAATGASHAASEQILQNKHGPGLLPGNPGPLLFIHYPGRNPPTNMDPGGFSANSRGRPFYA
jgi:hypothetical protein